MFGVRPQNDANRQQGDSSPCKTPWATRLQWAKFEVENSSTTLWTHPMFGSKLSTWLWLKES